MGIMDKLQKNSRIKETDTLDKSKIFSNQEMVPTKVPMINVALSGDPDGGLTSGLTVLAGPSKNFKTSFGLLMAAAYLEKYDHPLWKRFEDQATGAGHGGMDFFVVRAFVEALKDNQTSVIDVYDAVSLSVIVPLSEKSIKMNSTSVKIPDFTRGKWKINQPIFGLTDAY